MSMFWCYWLFVIISFIEVVLHYFFYADYIHLFIRGEEVKIYQLLIFILLALIPISNIVLSLYIFMGTIIDLCEGHLHLRKKFEKVNFKYLNEVKKILTKRIF